MNTGCYRLYRMMSCPTCGRHQYNPVTAWLNAHAAFVGWVGSFLFGVAFWTTLILWWTE